MEKKIIYTNQIQLAMQSLDFTLLLNTATPDGEVENQAIVFMSPQHAKSLLNVLADNIRNYELLFGTISLEANADNLRELQTRGVIRDKNEVRQ